MSSFFVEEYSDRLKWNWSGDTIPLPAELLATQEIEIGVASVASAAFNARTRFVRISADIDVKFKVADVPVAVSDATCRLCRKEEARELIVEPGQKVAVIQR